MDLHEDEDGQARTAQPPTERGYDLAEALAEMTPLRLAAELRLASAFTALSDAQNARVTAKLELDAAQEKLGAAEEEFERALARVRAAEDHVRQAKASHPPAPSPRGGGGEGPR